MVFEEFHSAHRGHPRLDSQITPITKVKSSFLLCHQGIAIFSLYCIADIPYFCAGLILVIHVFAINTGQSQNLTPPKKTIPHTLTKMHALLTVYTSTMQSSSTALLTCSYFQQLYM